MPIPGTGSPEHAEENIAAAAINDLTRDEMEAINKGGLSKQDGKPEAALAGRHPPRVLTSTDGARQVRQSKSGP